ncbi:MAG: cob(I)yrinic acid a,c-diamide adenosyltransferase [Candidatus Harrisonbacteria bacterium CG10_big_fil_rev_8_21_14_0_10_42_17]|uniref:Cob(I)yrinic acid a,c-diamide adenosyltransferase n=1 Tax=Candidatus Harrisonbacteria bacterium CG10_big_fil_rev_8_21_14_0_10_42_17 TaxID=1974584 RepID=A0A2M6WIZ2_9BACT|nr:MAG: cob(I)yrinic acid a,c-diamide adenosyltransferase [Candidatus Harrisonbacteria bacterium CG10_big_fil_rev_8_21_14_0_10_42_17]
MLIVFTGNGKGKTTAALGQAFRMLGRDKRVLMIQFIKGPWKSGEDHLVQRIRNQELRIKETDESLLDELHNFYDFKIKKMGLGFVGIQGDTLPRERHVEVAQKALSYFETQLASGGWNFIILDEINVATSLGLLTETEVLDAVKDLAPEKFVLFTGRGAPQSFIDRADLATEMRELKHPFNDGKMAQIAVEF